MSRVIHRPGGETPEHGADPWWGPELDRDGTAFVDLDAPVAMEAAVPSSPAGERRLPRGTRVVGRPASRPSTMAGIIGLLGVPVVALAGVVRRSPRLRRYAIRAMVICAILAALACSVGVILINNVVIGRTAELGRLDGQRRELRRENALLGAEAAQLSAPQVIERSARTELGMVRPDRLPRFIFLDPASRVLTPQQRQLVAARNARLLAAREATPRAAAPAASPVPDGAATP